MTDLRLTEEERSRLRMLADEVSTAYQRSTAERASIHEIDWAARGERPSVLMEAEVRADFVAGLAERWPAEGIALAEGEDLVARSIPRSTVLSDWLRDQSDRFPAFATYLAAIEHLRSLLAYLLEQRAGPCA